jgi:SAM-dependent methyltransferase
MIEKYKLINGIKCYNPDVALENSDYPAESFKLLFEIEDENFWFVNRNHIIKHLFKKHLGEESNKVLEIGCGTGYVLKGLYDRFKKYDLYGSEIHLEGIQFAQNRLPNIEFIQLDATHMPFENEFDAIGAFDVLEHIEEDVKVIQEVHNSLKKGGFFIISVPQHQWMWSINDDIAYHKRRYSRKELKNKLINEGFEIVYISSFVFILFPFMYISRFFKQKIELTEITNETILKEMNELKLNPLVNSIFGLFMKADVFLIKMGISLPFGGSLIAVAKKIENDTLQ